MIFKPESFLKRIFPSGFWNRSLLNKDLDFKQTAKRAILKATSLSGREVDATVDKVIKLYEHKRDLIDGTADVEKITNNGALLRQRLENLILYNEIQEQKEEHKGEYYRWLPSSAETPDPEHQLLYGKIFKVGEGDKDGNMPSERYGCRCGMELLTDAEKKDIEARLGNKKITVKQDKTKNIDNAVKTPDEFMPAETIAEAQLFAEKKGIEADYSFLQIDQANALNKVMNDIEKDFPNIIKIKKISHLKSAGKGIIAEYDGFEQRISFKKLNTIKEAERKAIETRIKDEYITPKEEIKNSVFKPSTNVTNFENGTEANKFMQGEGGILERRKNGMEGQWLAKLSPDEREAVSFYTADGYGDVNDYLRKIGDFSGYEQGMNEFVKDLDKAINKFELRENIKVYRGVKEEVFKGIKDLKQLIGKEHIDLGYSSSSLLKSVDIVKNNGYILEITVPKGKGNGAYINALAGQFKDVEYEFLIKRNAKFKIYDIDNSGHTPVIKMELINE